MKKRFFALVLYLMLTLCVMSSCVVTEQTVNKSEDIVILYTNDVHCAYNENLGYESLVAYKKIVKQKTDNVTLVDCGDAIQGGYIGTVSKGEYIVEIMNEVGYDFAILGNHEFDYGIDQLQHLVEMSNAQYLSCNLKYTGDNENKLSDIKAWDIVDYGDVQVAFVGISTPSTIQSSTPDNFVEDGEFVYDFYEGNNGQDLYDVVQKSVDESIEAGADYVIALTHLGNTPDDEPYSSIDVIENTTGIDVVLDAHAHSTIVGEEKLNKNNEPVILSSTGEYLNNFGQLVITEEGYITTSFVKGNHQQDPEFASFITDIEEKFSAGMNTVLAHSDMELKIRDKNGFRIVRNQETTIGNLCADAYRSITGADIAIVNGGGIRNNIPAGDITYGDIISVLPYGNSLCLVEVTGQQVIDCLEMAYRKTQAITNDGEVAIGESGGFQHLSGIRCEIDVNIPSPIVTEGDVFVRVEGQRRVKNVEVLASDGNYYPIELDKTYTLASHNYTLKMSGDGMSMFKGCNILINESIADYQVLIEYISKVLKGNIAEKYSSTEGRITIIK